MHDETNGVVQCEYDVADVRGRIETALRISTSWRLSAMAIVNAKSTSLRAAAVSMARSIGPPDRSGTRESAKVHRRSGSSADEEGSLCGMKLSWPRVRG